MNKPKFSIRKATRTVEISSRIEGHKIPKKKHSSLNRNKNRTKH